MRSLGEIIAANKAAEEKEKRNADEDERMEQYARSDMRELKGRVLNGPDVDADINAHLQPGQASECVVPNLQPGECKNCGFYECICEVGV